MISRITLAIVLLVSIGCGGEDDLCDFEITNTVGSQPEYMFTDGPAERLVVVRVAAPVNLVWGVTTVPDDNLTSPIRQGIVPAGALETETTERNLVPGIEYRVIIDKSSGSSCVHDFVP